MKSLRELKGVGEKTEKLLAKAGLRTTGDLLRYYPRRYEMYDEPVLIRNLREGEVCTIHAQAITNPETYYSIIYVPGSLTVKPASVYISIVSYSIANHSNKAHSFRPFWINYI